MPLLELEQLCLDFGGLRALDGFDWQVEEGALIALIGPNGAGKTTVFNLISGIYAPSAGRIQLRGRSLAGLRPHAIARSGIARTFQNIRLFRGLSVLDHVRAALVANTRSSLRDVLRPPGWPRNERSLTGRALELIDRLGLAEHAEAPAETLPYGEQRRLEIARALAVAPRLLLLDEPAAGMNPSEKQELRELIGRLRSEFGLTIALIEHDVHFVMNLCERITVLDHGEKIAEGPPAAVRSDPRVIEAYLGSEEAATA